MRISFILGLVVGLSFVFGLHQTKNASGQIQIMKQLGLNSGELITIEQPSKSELGITMNGQNYMVDYSFFSLRSKDFRLMLPSETGELVEVEAPPVSTIRGTIRGMDGSSVVGCVSEEGCCAKIRLPSGDECFIEPVSRTLDNPAFAGVHVVYTGRDVIDEGIVCGNEASNVATALKAAENSAAATRRLGPLSLIDLAVEADFDFFLDHGSTSATLREVENLLNIANEQFERQASIRHLVGDCVIRVSRGDNPWNDVVDEAAPLLDALRTYYTAGEGVGTIDGDICYLFTGRTLNRQDNPNGSFSFIGGRARVDVICNPAIAFGLVSNISTRMNGTASTLAHELGHSWSLRHCNENEFYNFDCPDSTMYSSSGGNLNFGTQSLPTLIAYRNTRTCLDRIGVPSGFNLTGITTINPNDDLANAIPIPDLNFARAGFNVNATTQRDEQDLTITGSTTWWSVTADSNGTLTIDTFGSDYDTQLHVYSFVPGSDITSLALVDNDDDSNSTLQSEVTIDVTAGTSYAIRVGGFRRSDEIGSGSEGNIDLNGEFTRSLLRGDVNLSGVVNFADIPTFIALLIAGEFRAEADINEDGEVTFADIPAFIEILIAAA